MPKKDLIKKRCPHCDAKMVEYRHTFNKQMVNCLFVLLDAGGKIKFSDLNGKLDYNQRNNFQKIQYWGLITKVPDQDIDWALTELAYMFLTGAASISKSVWTYRNKFVRLDGEQRHIKSFGYEPYRQKPDYVQDERPRYVNDSGQFEFFR